MARETTVVFGVALVIVSCAARAPETVPSAPITASTPTPTPTVPAPSVPPLEPLFACRDTAAHLVVDEEIDEICWPLDHCPVTVPFTIENCTDEDLYLRAMSIEVMGWELAVPSKIVAHTRRSFTLPSSGSSIPLGKHPLRIGLEHADEARPPVPVTASFTLVDTAKDHAIADCKGKGNDWGFHGGIISEEGCAEVMKDAGKVCHDGRDCEGFCILESSRPAGNKTLLTGKCTRLKSRFGCNVTIGDTDHGLVPKNTHFGRMCVD